MVFSCTRCNTLITMRASHHLNGQGCKNCNQKQAAVAYTKTQTQFIKEALFKHNSFYGYSKAVYTNDSTKVTITCPIHGDFEQRPNHHLRGIGCNQCGVEKTRINSSNKENCWSYSGWEASGKSSDYFDAFKLYIIQCHNDAEIFYKIGKTFTPLSVRFTSSNLPYNWELIAAIEGTAEYISTLEHTLHTNLKAFKYTPTHSFVGYTECFKFKD